MSNQPNHFYGNVKDRIIGAIDHAISIIVRNKCEFSCTALAHSLSNREKCNSDGVMYDEIIKIYQKHLHANVSSGGFGNHSLWDIYPSFIQKKIRISKLVKLRNAVFNSSCLEEVIHVLKNS